MADDAPADRASADGAHADDPPAGDPYRETTDEEAEAELVAHARTLADGICDALPGWVERCVAERIEAWTGEAPDDDVLAAAAAAGEQARLEVGVAVAGVLDTDIDAQRASPLSLLRGAVRYPSAVLDEAGVPPVVRDEFAERNFPDDVYDLTPASFADVDPALHEPGLVWGAAKAHVHLRRRRREGRS